MLSALSCSGVGTRVDSKTGDSACPSGAVLGFTPDLGGADEAYVCYGFDADPFGATSIRSVHWDIGTGGPFTVHHAILYAVPDAYPDGPVPCGGMPPGGVELHVWSPGGSDLALPSNVGLRLPASTKRFVIEAHLLRIGAGQAAKSTVNVCGGAPASIDAALIATGAPVPAIRPLHEEKSAGGCTLAGSVHLWSVWPHMHLAGKEIVGELVRADGTAETLVDVVPWDFTNQRTYPLSVDAVAGDSIRAACTWDNPTTNTILPGPLTGNEMCNLVLIGWPAASANCPE